MDPKTKQKVLRLLTNGMYILTSRSAKSFGAATVTWVSQASFKPPLLMVALRKDGSAFQCVVESRVHLVHVLEQTHVDGVGNDAAVVGVAKAMANQPRDALVLVIGGKRILTPTFTLFLYDHLH